MEKNKKKRSTTTVQTVKRQRATKTSSEQEGNQDNEQAEDIKKHADDLDLWLGRLRLFFNNTAPPETYQPKLCYHTDAWMDVNLSQWTIYCPSPYLMLLVDNI